MYAPFCILQYQYANPQHILRLLEIVIKHVKKLIGQQLSRKVSINKPHYNEQGSTGGSTTYLSSLRKCFAKLVRL